MSFFYDHFFKKGENVSGVCWLISICLDAVPGVVACSCNSPASEAAFGSGVGLLPVESSNPSVGGWIV